MVSCLPAADVGEEAVGPQQVGRYVGGQLLQPLPLEQFHDPMSALLVVYSDTAPHASV
jgi:hypothetical protein